MPHLYELRPLPTEIGGVPISWVDPNKEEKSERRIARRDGRSLLLPNHWDNDFLPLGDGKLLFLNHSSSFRSYSFCGMDEVPFHVFVRGEAVNAYKRGGAEGFFESLIPDVMKLLRERTDIPGEYRRQGDWFAHRLPFSWGEIERMISLSTGQELVRKSVRKEQLGGTRHRVTGTLARGVQLFGTKFMVAEGVVSAPDHRPLVLDGPHAVAQAVNLADPEDAE